MNKASPANVIAASPRKKAAEAKSASLLPSISQVCRSGAPKFLAVYVSEAEFFEGGKPKPATEDLTPNNED